MPAAVPAPGEARSIPKFVMRKFLEMTLIAPELAVVRRVALKPFGLAAAISAAAIAAQAAEVQLHPVPENATPSRVFHVKVNGTPVFTEAFKDIHYVHFSAEGEVTVEVEAPAMIHEFSISPKSREVEADLWGPLATLKVREPGQLVVTVNKALRLFLFVDPIDRSVPVPGAPGVASILDFNVDPTGRRLDTARIQHAIDAVAGRGGVLYFPPGTYLTGTLALKSNLTVHLAGGAVILGSPNRNDYPVDRGFKEADHVNDPENYSNQGAKMTYSRLILVDNARNVRITGRGVIDGQGKIVRDQGKPANLIRIRNASDVTVEGVILRDPAAWNTHVLHSDNVTFRNVKIVNDRTVKNTDGINPDASRDVLIEDCFFYCGDDTIAIKTSGNSNFVRNAERITVRGCIMLTKKSAMKLGTESFADYQRDITFEDNDVVEADRAMSLYCSDGAKFESIRWLNNRIERTYPDVLQRTIHFRVIDRGGEEAGHIRDILIKDTEVATASPNPPTMQGYDEEHGIRDIRFVNFKVGGEMCRSAADARLETNEFVSGVTFWVDE